jgi:hypothetical protein
MTAARDMSAVSSTGQRRRRGDPSPIYLYRDTRLDALLARLNQSAATIRAAATDDDRTERIISTFSGVDLADPDNLEPVSNAVSRLFSDSTLILFLQRVETDARVRTTAEEEARVRRTIALLQVQRNPFGGHTPLPTTELITATAQTVGRGASLAGRGIAAFFEGVLDGLRERVTDSVVDALRRRLLGSMVLNAVFPGVFAAGAIAGIGRDVWRTLRGVYDLITNFDAMLAQFRDIFELLVSPTGPAISRLFGRVVGREHGDEVARLAQHNVFRFTFELGLMIGPAIVYAVLAILGIGVAEIAARASTAIVQILRGVPALARLVQRIGRFFRRARPGPLAGVTDAEIAAAVEQIEVPRVTGPRSRPRIGDRPVPTRKVPRLEASDIPRRAGEQLADAVARIRRIIGQRVSDSPDMLSAWNRAVARVRSRRGGPPSDPRELFNAVRDKFWEEVRQPGSAATFSRNGFILPNDPRRAARLGGVPSRVPPQEVTVSLDHNVEIRVDPSRALDPTNLTFEFSAPNSFREIVQMRHPSMRQ